jgi:hypothetical protein
MIPVSTALLKRIRKRRGRDTRLRREPERLKRAAERAEQRRRGITTANLVVRRAIELFHNANAFLRMKPDDWDDEVNGNWGDPTPPSGRKPGDTLRIRLPATYTTKIEP